NSSSIVCRPEGSRARVAEDTRCDRSRAVGRNAANVDVRQTRAGRHGRLGLCRAATVTVRSLGFQVSRLPARRTCRADVDAPEVLLMRTRVHLPLFAPSLVCACLAALGLIASAGEAAAQTPSTPLVPYFGKNNIHYDRF